MIKLRYGNTNTFYIPGAKGGLLIDTDWAGTLPQFFKAIKSAGLGISDISYVLATHYHPDHVGIIGELQRMGVVLLVADVQRGFLHFPDEIFSRDKRLHYVPINKSAAKVLTCEESRAFLHSLDIGGEIVHTPSHSEDSISILLDDGETKETVVLDRPNKGLYLSHYIWREMFDFSDDAVLMVLASKLYDESDYIRSYDEFLQFVQQQRGEENGQ